MSPTHILSVLTCQLELAEPHHSCDESIDLPGGRLRRTIGLSLIHI